MDVGEAEALAVQIQHEVQEDVAHLRRDRHVTLSVYFFYGFFLVFFSTMFCVLLFLYRDTWDQSCDLGTKIWSLVWVARMVAQLICNTLVTAGRVGRIFGEGGAAAADAAAAGQGDAGLLPPAGDVERNGAAAAAAGGGNGAALHQPLHLQHQQQRVPRWLVFLTRLVHAFGFSWWMLGIDQIFCEPRCPDQTLSHTVSQCMFWITATVYIVPFLLYTLVCLCLPCIIYFMVRLAVRPADRQPTPPSVIQQLEVKTYRDLLETLRREYTIDSQEVSIQQQRRPLPGLSLESVIGGVSTLLATSGATAAATSTNNGSETTAAAAEGGIAGGAAAGEGAAAALLRGDGAAAADVAAPFRSSNGMAAARRGAAAGGRRDSGGAGRSISSSRRRLLLEDEEEEEEEDQLQQGRARGGQAFAAPTAAAPSPQRVAGLLAARQSISINKACPICMVDLNDDDQLLIMPCDQRHFFHKACVEHWLETSQACPICRANIVHILTGAPADGAVEPSDHRDLEMQV